MEQHQMPCWYYEKEELLRTPSYYVDIDVGTETRYRREGARFIFDISNHLHLRYDTWATAIVFFHRFYMCHSFKEFPRHVTAACCLMLAGKVEETPKKCRDIIRTARELLPPEIFATFGSDPREEVMMYERVLLKTIKFDLQVSHPYSFLLQYAKRLKGDPEKIKEMVQMSWSFINDSLETTLCLQWEPEIVACAVLYLATRMKNWPVTDWEGRRPGQAWWECFVEGMSVEVMEDICHMILDIYSDGSKTENAASKPVDGSVKRSATNSISSRQSPSNTLPPSNFISKAITTVRSSTSGEASTKFAASVGRTGVAGTSTVPWPAGGLTGSAGFTQPPPFGATAPPSFLIAPAMPTLPLHVAQPPAPHAWPTPAVPPPPPPLMSIALPLPPPPPTGTVVPAATAAYVRAPQNPAFPLPPPPM